MFLMKEFIHNILLVLETCIMKQGPISSNCLAQKFAQHEISASIKTGLPTKFPRDVQDEQTTAETQ